MPSLRVTGTIVGADGRQVQCCTNTLILDVEEAVWAVSAGCLFANQRQNIIDNISGGCGSSGGTVVFGSISTGTVTSSNITLCAPTGTSCGDLLITVIGHGNGASFSTCSLFTHVRQITGDSGTGPAINIWYRVAGASEPSTYNWSAGVSSWVAQIYRFTGGYCVATPAPRSAIAVWGVTCGTSFDPAQSCIAGVANHAVITVIGSGTNGGNVTATCVGSCIPACYTLGGFTLHSNDSFIYSAYRILCAATGDNPGAFTTDGCADSFAHGTILVVACGSNTSFNATVRDQIPVGCVVRTTDNRVTVTIPPAASYCEPGVETIDVTPPNSALWTLLDHRQQTEFGGRRGNPWLGAPFLANLVSNFPKDRVPIFNDSAFITYAWPGLFNFVQSINFYWSSNVVVGDRWAICVAGSLRQRLFNSGLGALVSSGLITLNNCPTGETGTASIAYVHGSAIAASTVVSLQTDGTGPAAFWAFGPQWRGDTNSRIYAVSAGTPPVSQFYVGPCQLPIRHVLLCIDNYKGSFSTDDVERDVCLILHVNEWREKIDTNAIVTGIGLYETLAFSLNFVKFYIQLKGVIPPNHPAHPLLPGIDHVADAIDLEEATLLFNQVGVVKDKARLRLPLPNGYRDYEGVIEEIAIITPPGSVKQEFSMKFAVDWSPSMPSLRAWNDE